MKTKLWYDLIDVIVIVALSTGVCFGIYFVYQYCVGHMMPTFLMCITSFLTAGSVAGIINFEQWRGKQEADDDR